MRADIQTAKDDLLHFVVVVAGDLDFMLSDATRVDLFGKKLQQGNGPSADIDRWQSLLAVLCEIQGDWCTDFEAARHALKLCRIGFLFLVPHVPSWVTNSKEFRVRLRKAADVIGWKTMSAFEAHSQYQALMRDVACKVRNE
eukprot:7827295-Karenia_brevis.AAC.1